MIKIEHFENGIKEFKKEVDFIFFVQKIFTENDDEQYMNMPQNAEECAKYIIDFCGNFEMIYYQPNLDIHEMNSSHYQSFHVYLQKENAQKDFPNNEIVQYKGNDIEDFSVLDYTESFN